MQNFWIWSGAKECRSCRARKMLKNAPTLAIVAVHTEENEPPRILIWNTTNIYIHYFIPRPHNFLSTRHLKKDSCILLECKICLHIYSLHSVSNWSGEHGMLSRNETNNKQRVNLNLQTIFCIFEIVQASTHKWWFWPHSLSNHDDLEGAPRRRLVVFFYQVTMTVMRH